MAMMYPPYLKPQECGNLTSVLGWRLLTRVAEVYNSPPNQMCRGTRTYSL
ncbi:hypothetical protein J7E85_31245 [Paenibacillus sp. ISL-20]|nr:hypothetical protein [Paenibacillus sp. ISL-20]